MTERTVFVDVDGVSADLQSAWLDRYNRDYDDHLTGDDIKTWSMADYVKPECGDKIMDYIEDPALYDEVLPIPGALEGVEYLRSAGYRVVFASTTTNGHAGRKLRWLIEHGFIKGGKQFCHDYIEIADKSLLRGGALVDDGPHNISAFHGLGVLFLRPHNHGFIWPVCVSGWKDIPALLGEINPPGTHPTELARPVQTRAFRNIIEQMYRVHLEKNHDYSPANILGTGELGLMTRTWDKVARLMNLTGFRIEISKSTFTAPQAPKCEAIEDTILDLAVYSIIWKLYRMGDWGK